MVRGQVERIDIPFRQEGEVTLRELARELNMDSSNLQKYAKRHGCKFFYVLTAETGRQPVLALTKEDARKVKQLWNKKILGPAIREASQEGYFYLMSIAPELPNRIKMGFSTNPDGRVKELRVFSPSAEILNSWRCRWTWEQTAIASITRDGCNQLANEVFDCEDVAAVIENAKRFFDLMPKLGKEGRNDQHD